MKAIVAVDLNWGIGYKGNLLERVPEDMRFFKQTTLGKVVVMGRETFESLPGREPLKDRTNILLSTSLHSADERLTICRSLDELAQELKKYPADDVFVIGGESVYAQLLPYCTEAYVTRFENTHEADKHFKNLDHDKAWKPELINGSLIYNELQYSRVKYVNSKPLTGTFS